MQLSIDKRWEFWYTCNVENKAEAIRLSPYMTEIVTKVKWCIPIQTDGACFPFFFLWRWTTISKELRINDQIRAREVRVVSDNNEQLGVMSLRSARQIAEERHLDLVEVAPNGRPPVCRIMNYGKYRYEQQKREKEAKKKQKILTLKEVKLRPNIEDHDFYVKMKAAQRFLGEGSKVKVTIMFRGREMSHPELGEKLLMRFADELKDVAHVEKEPKVEGRNMTMVIAVNKAK